jgi:protein-tyrosine phosphatase
VAATPQDTAPFRILTVCTANICRSVLAEHFLRREIDRRGLDVVVESCGLRFDDQPASDSVLAVLAEREIDASGHRSRRCTAAMISAADLVVTMERAHARELTVSVEGASSRIHTLGALVEWLGESDDLTGSPADRVARFATEREASHLLGSGPDEVADPHGRSKRVHRRAADRIESLVVGLLDGLFGPGDAG